MGDIADYIIEQGLDEISNHQRGECDGYCQECYDEMTEEEQKEFLSQFENMPF